MKEPSRRPPALRATGQMNHPDPHGTHPILVADDSATMRRVLESFLTKAEYRIVLLEDGNAALEEVMARPYSLIILDMIMPGHSGLSIIKQLRTNGVALPAILISGWLQDKGDRISEELDNVICLQKPFEEHDLIAAVRKLTSK